MEHCLFDGNFGKRLFSAKFLKHVGFFKYFNDTPGDLHFYEYQGFEVFAIEIFRSIIFFKWPLVLFNISMRNNLRSYQEVTSLILSETSCNDPNYILSLFCQPSIRISTNANLLIYVNVEYLNSTITGMTFCAPRVRFDCVRTK
jgi:hypothetical protein